MQKLTAGSKINGTFLAIHYINILNIGKLHIKSNFEKIYYMIEVIQKNNFDFAGKFLQILFLNFLVVMNTISHLYLFLI